MRNSLIRKLFVAVLVVPLFASLVGVFAPQHTGNGPVSMASGPGPMPTDPTSGVSNG